MGFFIGIVYSGLNLVLNDQIAVAKNCIRQYGTLSVYDIPILNNNLKINRFIKIKKP
jgi:hypothetical protein